MFLTVYHILYFLLKHLKQYLKLSLLARVSSQPIKKVIIFLIQNIILQTTTNCLLSSYLLLLRLGALLDIPLSMKHVFARSKYSV